MLNDLYPFSTSRKVNHSFVFISVELLININDFSEQRMEKLDLLMFADSNILIGLQGFSKQSIKL
jgi:hypothetical protein